MRKTLLYLCLLLTSIMTGPAAAHGLPRQIVHALRRADLPARHVGIVVQYLGHKRPILARNTSRPFNPASVMKVLTTLAALDTFGPAHTFKTRVLTDGKLADGTLKGDLIIQGGGDPALNLEHFWSLVHAIRERGIRRIDGDVIIDNGFFAVDPADPGAFDGKPLKAYNADPAALLVNYNALPVFMEPEKDGVEAKLNPPCLAVKSSVRPTGRSNCRDWDEDLSFNADGNRLEISGQYPAACGDRTLWLNLLRPPATAAKVFAADWQEAGGTLTGQIRPGRTPKKAVQLLDFDSPELSEIVRGTNKYSNNVMAKMLFLDLGADRYGAPATRDKGRRAIHAWLREKGLKMPRLVVDNGSGLSRVARITPADVARLLIWAARQPLYYEFAASLPALGLEGTQRHRLNDTPLAGRAWLKSGSLVGVHNLAGYVLDARGRRKIVVLFINDGDCRDVAGVQAAVLNWAIDRRHVLH